MKEKANLTIESAIIANICTLKTLKETLQAGNKICSTFIRMFDEITKDAKKLRVFTDDANRNIMLEMFELIIFIDKEICKDNEKSVVNYNYAQVN